MHAHIHGGEELAIVLKRRHHVKNSRIPKGLGDRAQGIGLEQLCVVGARRQRFAFVIGVGAEQCHALAVADVHVVYRGRIAVHRLEHRLQLHIVAHRLCHQLPQLTRIVGIDGAVSEAALQRILQCEPHLPRHHQVGIVGLLHRRSCQLVHVEQRYQPRDEEHQGRDGQHEFGLQAHGESIFNGKGRLSGHIP